MRRAKVVLAVLVLASSVASPAQADPVPREPSAAFPHCVVTAIEVGAREADPVPAIRCYATFSQAIAAATNGRVVLPPDARTVDESTLQGGAGVGSNGIELVSARVLGIEYEHRGFLGWSYTIQTTNPRGCVGYSYRIPTLPSSRNNAISSALTYAGCKSSHYSGTYLTGSRYLCGCSQMGTMNDQTSSIFFSSTGFRD